MVFPFGLRHAVLFGFSEKIRIMAVIGGHILFLGAFLGAPILGSITGFSLSLTLEAPPLFSSTQHHPTAQMLTTISSWQTSICKKWQAPKPVQASANNQPSDTQRQRKQSRSQTVPAARKTAKHAKEQGKHRDKSQQPANYKVTPGSRPSRADPARS